VRAACRPLWLVRLDGGLAEVVRGVGDLFWRDIVEQGFIRLRRLGEAQEAFGVAVGDFVSVVAGRAQPQMYFVKSLSFS
jgi:hypothetical protein